MFAKTIHRIAGVYDLLNTESSRQWLKTIFVGLAVSGFLVHLALIGMVRTLPEIMAPIAGVGNNFIKAIYTPFSFILFYEVLLLVLALPKSITTSICKQYEIISLIVVRRAFKDIGAFEDFDSWLTQPDAVRIVLFDMAGALVMFLAVTLFYRVRRSVVKTAAAEGLQGFIQLKKAISVLLGVVFICLAMFNLGWWLLAELPGTGLAPAVADIDQFFFPTFFELMIFTDVLLLIASINYYDRYEYLFRNSGFVISTVLLRISLSTEKPLDLVIALVAIIYGLALISIFAFFTRVSTGRNGRNTRKASSQDAATQGQGVAAHGHRPEPSGHI